jgi:hypothetical protein
MMLRSSILLLVLSCACWAQDIEATPGGVDLQAPGPGKSWRHGDSGLELPTELGELKMESIHHWPEAKHQGYGVRYLHKSDPIRAEVFIYKAETPMEDRAAMLLGVRNELGQLWLNATRVEKTGRYSELKHNSPITDALNLPPSGETLLAHSAFSMKMAQRDGQPYDARMWYGVIPFKRYWVRLRVTMPDGGEDEAEEKTQNFVRAVVAVVQEPGMRAAALEAMPAYRADPLSEPARRAADLVLLFAREHPIHKVVLPVNVTKVLASVESVVADARLDLQRAFILAAMEETLKGSTQLEASVSGIKLMSEVVAKLQARHPQLAPEALSKMLAAVKADQIKDWIAQ